MADMAEKTCSIAPLSAQLSDAAPIYPLSCVVKSAVMLVSDTPSSLPSLDIAQLSSLSSY